MSAAITSIPPMEAVKRCSDFLHTFIPEAKDIVVEEFNMEPGAQWFVALGFNLPSPLDVVRTPFGRQSLERDHHRRFKFEVDSGKVVSMTSVNR